MRATKTWQLLATLSPRELKAFEEMLDSPYCNKNLKLKELYFLFRPSLANSEFACPSPESAFANLFPGEPFHHPKLRYLLTDLAKLVTNFMTLEALKAKPQWQDRLRLEEFRRRGLDKYFEQGHREALEAWEAKPVRDAGQLLHRFQLEELGLDYEQSIQNRQAEDILPSLLQSLSQFTLATTLKYLCELINRRNVLASPANEALLLEVRRQLEDKNMHRVPAITLYELVLNTLTQEDNPHHYQQLRAGLRSHASAFTRSELGHLYAFALNYCIKRFNLGDAEFLRELYSLYQELIEGNILQENGILAPQHFKNIVAVGIRLQEFDWTRDFIDRLHTELPPAEQRNAYIYNMACLNFASKRFAEAKKLLQQVMFTDVYYQLDARALLAKCYYELEEEEPLFSLIAAFRLFLRRNKAISEYQRRLYFNMLRLLEKMAKARLNPTLPSDALILEVLEAKEVADAAWLRKQAEALR